MEKNNTRAIATSALLLLLSALHLSPGASLCAQTPTAATQMAAHNSAIESADQQAKEWIAKGAPGLALAVAVNGRLVYSEAFGYADLEERVPVWPTTKFRIGSIS